MHTAAEAAVVRFPGTVGVLSCYSQTLFSPRSPAQTVRYINNVRSSSCLTGKPCPQFISVM